MSNKSEFIRVLTEISKDLEEDMSTIDGMELTGHNVGVQFGKQAAAIDALAKILKQIVEMN